MYHRIKIRQRLCCAARFSLPFFQLSLKPHGSQLAEVIALVGLVNHDQGPIILSFQGYEEEQQVTKSAYKQKGTDTSVQNDYSQNTLRKCELLWNSASEEKQQKRKISLINKKLCIDSSLSVWDDTENSRVKIEKYNNPKKDCLHFINKGLRIINISS